MLQPLFLDATAKDVANLSPEEFSSRSKHLSNWLVLHDYFNTIPSSRQLMELLVIELASDKPRMEILERLHGRIKETRHREERAQLEFPEEDK